MSLRGHWSERRGTEEPPWPYSVKVMAKAVPHLDTQIDMPNQGAKADNANSRTGP
jgi:hypothetical protein